MYIRIYIQHVVCIYIIYVYTHMNIYTYMSCFVIVNINYSACIHHLFVCLFEHDMSMCIHIHICTWT